MRGSVMLGIALMLVAACGRGGSPVHTLYRSESVVGDTARIHVATFDADDESESYNRDTCEQARELYQVQPANRARYWCEPGRFRKKR